MPTPDQILIGLSRIANDWISLAVAFHIYYGLLAIMTLAGVSASRRLGGILLALPLMSVGFLAWINANPFNGTLFTLAPIGLIAIAITLPGQSIVIAQGWMLLTGGFLLLFGLIYPHFLNVSSAWMFLCSAPTGLIPCPTLSASAGLALIWNGLGSRLWMLILGIIGLSYGIFGAFVLNVQLDLILLFGAAMTVTFAFKNRDRKNGPCSLCSCGTPSPVRKVGDC